MRILRLRLTGAPVLSTHPGFRPAVVFVRKLESRSCTRTTAPGKRRCLIKVAPRGPTIPSRARSSALPGTLELCQRSTQIEGHELDHARHTHP